MLQSGIIELDVHSMNRAQAKTYIDSQLKRAKKDIYQIKVIHGYRGGTAIRDMVRKTYRNHPKVVRVELPLNLSHKCGKIRLIKTAFFLIEKGKKVKYMYKYRGGLKHMVQAELTITNEQGIHLGPANKIANLADRYDCQIHFKTDYMDVNAKSIINLISGTFRHGDVVQCVCNGPDEEEALAAMKRILSENLEE